MGFIKTIDSKRIEIEEFRRFLLNLGDSTYRKAKGEHGVNGPLRGEDGKDEEYEEDMFVCVTSGLSFLGLAIVNCLLDHGYAVRIALDNEGDLEKLREMEMFEETRGNQRQVSAVVVKVTDIESLREAFHGCAGVFHTSAFVDPAGVSGYTKYMAELEVKASENVMEACARTESVTKCVFTSSLLACVWGENALHGHHPVIDHSSWSEESVCRDKKLWLALGKTMAERAAWRVAEDNEMKLATLCPGLITGAEFFPRNPTSSIAYMKGAQEMYSEGLLATTDVSKVAEAHMYAYEGLRNKTCGRYICFDRVIQTKEEAVEIARQTGIPQERIVGNNPSDSPMTVKLCNRKLLRLMSRQSRCSY